MTGDDMSSSHTRESYIGRIPVRNIWFLMLYASHLTRFHGMFKTFVDADAGDLPDLVAQLLAQSVERRLRRNLTRGYRRKDIVLHRVRGRIDILTTEARQLLSNGQVFCCFEDLTMDMPRNRLVRAALDLLARMVDGKDLKRRCRTLAIDLARLGVGGSRPSRAEIVADQIGRNDASDHFMVALARLAFDLALPTEDAGSTHFVCPDREEAWARRLFEKAVLGFARVELEPRDWSVRGGTPLDWQTSSASEGLAKILPRMVTDIVLDPPNQGRRLVIDTKFSSIVKQGRFGQAKLDNHHLYQIYAYLRSQEGREPRWNDAAGLLLHPAIHVSVHHCVAIQHHPITFATIDLAASAFEIRCQLRKILGLNIVKST